MKCSPLIASLITAGFLFSPSITSSSAEGVPTEQHERLQGAYGLTATAGFMFTWKAHPIESVFSTVICWRPRSATSSASSSPF